MLRQITAVSMIDPDRLTTLYAMKRKRQKVARAMGYTYHVGTTGTVTTGADSYKIFLILVQHVFLFKTKNNLCDRVNNHNTIAWEFLHYCKHARLYC